VSNNSSIARGPCPPHASIAAATRCSEKPIATISSKSHWRPELGVWPEERRESWRVAGAPPPVVAPAEWSGWMAAGAARGVINTAPAAEPPVSTVELAEGKGASASRNGRAMSGVVTPARSGVVTPPGATAAAAGTVSGGLGEKEAAAASLAFGSGV